MRQQCNAHPSLRSVVPAAHVPYRFEMFNGCSYPASSHRIRAVIDVDHARAAPNRFRAAPCQFRWQRKVDLDGLANTELRMGFEVDAAFRKIDRLAVLNAGTDG